MREQNSKHQIPNTNNGITLIALVITIIVMLILVAVTISMAVNGGLFDFAGRAATETENAINKEQLLAEGKIEIDGTWYNSIDEYVNAPQEIHNWTRSGDTFTCSHCNTTYTMGEVVNYTASGTSTLYGHKLGMTESSEVEGNEITVIGQDTEWIVLGIEDTNGNGVSETLLITSEFPVGIMFGEQTDGLPLKGAAGYNNGVEEINRICKELYSNSSYGEARGMTIEDVNRTLGYSPTTAYYYGEDGWTATGNLTTKLKELDIFEAMVESGTYTPDGANTAEALGEYVLNGNRIFLTGTDYLTLKDDLGKTELKTITEIERDTIFGASRNYNYWLSTQTVCAEIYGSTFASFGLAYVRDVEVFAAGNDFFSDTANEGIDTRGLRPVVSLTSKLPTSVN